MIPKIIHYCWFGGNQLPELAIKCLESWKKFCPDYRIIEWNEKNFDVNCCAYVKEAYEEKKYAFVTDYVRLKALYEYGGIYMDTDVEVCKPLDCFLHNHAFGGFESNNSVATAIMASEKGHKFFAMLLDYYKDRHFKLENGGLNLTTNVLTITNIAKEKGIVLNNQKQTIENMVFYPKDVFCPKDYLTGNIVKTTNTVCIHHFNQSWLSEKERDRTKRMQNSNRKYGKVGIFIYRFKEYTLHPINIIEKIKQRNANRSGK